MAEGTAFPEVVRPTSANGAHSNNPSDLLDLITVRDEGEDSFVGWCHAGAPRRVMGGQVAAQALAAAGATVPDDRVPHSLHGYFLREGRPERPITYQVARNRDGRSYSARQVTASQDGEEIFVLTASFVRPGPGPERQLVAPSVPGPETEPDVYDVWRSHHPEAHAQAVYVRAAQVHLVPRPVGPIVPAPDGSVSQDVWLRWRGPLPDDALVQACALTYLSDVTLAQSSGFEHDLIYTLHPARPRVGLASIDHAVWFHRPLRADAWVLLRQSSSTSSAGRGFNTGSFWSADGVMVASAAQESVVRLLPERPPHDVRRQSAHADHER